MIWARSNRMMVPYVQKRFREIVPDETQPRKLKRLGQAHALAVRFKRQGVPVVPGWRARPIRADLIIPSDGGALGTRWVYLRMASSAKSPWKVFEMLHHYRSVGDKYRPIDLFVVCSDSTAEHVLWEEGKGLRLITTTLAEAMSGQLVGPNTVWRRFGESVSIYPRIVPTDHPER